MPKATTDVLPAAVLVAFRLQRHILLTAAEIARGLQYLHHPDRRLVHRDLTATNVLLATHGDERGFRALLSDFGGWAKGARGGPSISAGTVPSKAALACQSASNAPLLRRRAAQPWPIAEPFDRAVHCCALLCSAGLSTTLSEEQTHRTSEVKGTIR